MKLTQEDYTVFKDFIKARYGIHFDESKRYIIDSRVMPIIKEHGCSDIGDFIKKIKYGSEEISEQFVDAITTSETLWFRDKSFFGAIEDHVVPWIIKKAGTDKVRIWSAAASSGQEAYSLAMLIDDALSRASLTSLKENIEILATDLSSAVLKKARAGRYTKHMVDRGMKDGFLERYFEHDGHHYEISGGVRSMVNFSEQNLLDNFTSLGTFDFIMCRYVMIYFTDAHKSEICEKLCRALKSGGLLAVGGSENLTHHTGLFKSFPLGKAILYRPGNSMPDLAGGVAQAAPSLVGR